MSKEYPYDMRYQTILGDVYLNNDKPQEALGIYQRILKEEPGYAPALVIDGFLLSEDRTG